MSTLVSPWNVVRDGDPRALGLFMRHYSSTKKPGARGNEARFVGNGEHLVLLTPSCNALFSWRAQRFRKDDQYGVECNIFRNESEALSSDLIREADDLAWRKWPGERLFTFVNPEKIRSTNPGYCFIKAGWRRLKKRSKAGLVILECLPEWRNL